VRVAQACQTCSHGTYLPRRVPATAKTTGRQGVPALLADLKHVER
jgi:hypothetical protein